MSIFFDTPKYLKHIESPRIPKGLTYKEEL